MIWVKEQEEKGKSYRFLSSIFDHLEEAIVVLDAKGQVIGLNPAAELMTGYRLGEMVEILKLCTLCAGMYTEESGLTCYDCFSTKEKVPSFQMMIRSQEGKEFVVSASSTHFFEDREEYLLLLLKKQREMLSNPQEEIQRQLTHHIIRAQEEERKRVSRDLHDSVGQALYSLMIGLKVLHQIPLAEEVRRHLNDLEVLASRALDEVKHMSVDLRPSALDDLGLVPAIRAFLKRFESTFGIETRFIHEGLSRRFDPNLETALYRILQEALNNAAKYADADHIDVLFKDDGSILELRIRDDGIGFDMENIEIKGTGLGLYGMKERAALFGGEVLIETKPGKGTMVLVTINLKSIKEREDEE